jgi:hypothetical protein
VFSSFLDLALLERRFSNADLTKIEKEFSSKKAALAALYDLGYKHGAGEQFRREKAELILALAKARGWGKTAHNMWLKAVNAGGWD